MKFVDTHTHLYLKHFRGERDKIIKDAINVGVEKMLLPNINSSTIFTMNQICRRFPKNCFAMIGLHPCDVKEHTIKKELKNIEEKLKKENYIAIGEIGIDLFWDKTTLELQKEAFRFQIELAKKYNLPIAIHIRNSFNEAFEIVNDMNDMNLFGVFHCFTGDKNTANKIINLGGFYLGIGGVLTFKNSGLKKTIKKIDLNHLVLETDSPFLAPTPYRGKRNESKYIVNIAEKLAEIHQVSIKEVAEFTTKNALELFKL